MRVIQILALIYGVCLQGFAGTITGVVPLPESQKSSVSVGKYRGKISGEVAKASPVVAGVWLESPSLTAPQKPKQVKLMQANYQFKRRLIIVPKGTSVVFPNDDPDYHNIYSLSKTKRFDLGRYKAGESPAPQVTFDKLGLVSLRCEIHDHMQADIIVVNSPHYTTTDSKGRFVLKNVPSGSYTLHAQIDKKTSWEISVVVDSKKSQTISFLKP